MILLTQCSLQSKDIILLPRNMPRQQKTFPLQGWFLLACVTLTHLCPVLRLYNAVLKISILNKEGIIKKISYERRDYESVDEKSLSLGYVPKKQQKKEGTNGLKIVTPRQGKYL